LPATCWQLVLVPLHVSVVQRLPPSAHAVPAGILRSVGHDVLVPVQVSTASHTSTAARHTAPAFPAGCWQLVLVPLHWSSVHGFPSSGQGAPAFPAGCVQAGAPTVPLHMSEVQALPSSVQAVPAALTRSGGQEVLDPVQVSARSQPLTAPRHTVPALPAAWMHVGAPTVPLHMSVVQTLPSSVQAVPVALTRSGGQEVLDPV